MEVLCNDSAHRDASSKVLGIVAAARDATRRAHAHTERESERECRHRAKELPRLVEVERFQRTTIDPALRVLELKKEMGLLGGSTRGEGSSGDDW